ncbi:MAG: methyltransferase domain-containing protein [Gammaproteobacteria bacterium]|nr:methyltransferase domain-containing protein [Gammaproteobacteria bacterium]
MRKAERFWDRTAENYESRVNENNQAAITTLDLARKHLEPKDIVLDYACASGKYAFEIAPQVSEVWGIDISSEMIRAAKRNAVERGIGNIQFLQAKITDPRLKDESFDVVLAFNILHLVDDPPEVINEIKGLLKPQGVFISITPCLGAGGSLTVMFIRFMSALGIVPRIHPYKPGDVEALIANAQLDILESQTISDSTSNTLLVCQKSA